MICYHASAVDFYTKAKIVSLLEANIAVIIITPQKIISEEYIQHLGIEDIERLKKISLKRQKDQFLAGRELVSVLSDNKNILQELKFSDLGKPYLENYFPFSLSYSENLVACGFSPAGEIGIDIEKLDNGNAFPLTQNTEREVCTENELKWLYDQEPYNEAFINIWVRKESMSKYFGTGLMCDLNLMETFPDKDKTEISDGDKKSQLIVHLLTIIDKQILVGATFDNADDICLVIVGE